jgi:hypothetical protein
MIGTLAFQFLYRMASNANFIKEKLEETLIISSKGLKHDQMAEIEQALVCYAQVNDILTDIIYHYNKNKSADSKKKVALLELKREKYLDRVSHIFETNKNPQLTVLYNTTTIKERTSPIQQNTNTDQPDFIFSGFYSTFLQTLRPPHVPKFIPYPLDPMLQTMTRLKSIAKSIRIGAFLTETLYIPPDIWTNSQKIENLDSKLTSIEMLTRPLLKIHAIQHQDPSLENFNDFQTAVNEFQLNINNTKQYLVLLI